MHTYDIIGAVIVLVLLAHWLIFRSDPRLPILVALALVLSVAGLVATGNAQVADILGNVFFYTLVLGVGEMMVDSYREVLASRKGVPRRDRPFFGEMPDWLKQRV